MEELGKHSIFPEKKKMRVVIKKLQSVFFCSIYGKSLTVP